MQAKLCYKFGESLFSDGLVNLLSLATQSKLFLANCFAPFLFIHGVTDLLFGRLVFLVLHILLAMQPSSKGQDLVKG